MDILFIRTIYNSNSNEWDANYVVRWSHKCPWKAIAQTFLDFLVLLIILWVIVQKFTFRKIFGWVINFFMSSLQTFIE